MQQTVGVKKKHPQWKNVRSETEKYRGRNLVNNKKKIGKWKRRPECAAPSSEKKIQTLQKKDQSSSIFFSLVFVFLQTVRKSPTWASTASLHRPTSGLHCRSKRKKERRHILFIRFLLLGGVLRLSTKSQSDKWWSRRTENKNKTKKTQTNKHANKPQKKKSCKQQREQIWHSQKYGWIHGMKDAKQKIQETNCETSLML